MATTASSQQGSSIDDRAGRGLDADQPLRMPKRAWKEILWRVWGKIGSDNISLLAAGVAFYAFLSLVPLLGALVLTYGLVADPSTIAENMKSIIGLVPHDAAKIINDQLAQLATADASKKGVGLGIALLLAIYGAMRAAGAIMTALNVVYEQHERRNYLKTSLISAVITFGAVLVGIAGLLAATMLAFLQSLVSGLGPIAIGAIKVASWLVSGGLASIAVAATYRYAPDRADAQWRWLSLGSALATILWILATLAFGAYAASFGNYNATYGSLSAVVVMLLWLWVSAYSILLGAEFNAEIERQTLRDSTTGRPRPMGQRGATMADTGPPAAKSD